MSTSIQRIRLPKELSQLKQNHHQHGIVCDIKNDTPDGHIYLEAKLPGPKSSPYEDGIFTITIIITDQYPFRPANFKFASPIYHPNIDRSGLICLDLLRMPPGGTYNPAITLETILLSIQLLMSNPNPDDPLNCDAADLYKENIEKFNEKARKYVVKYCLQKTNSDGNDNTTNNVILKSSSLDCDDKTNNN